METLLYYVIACGALAVLYGIVTSRQILNAPAGTDRMREIAAGIQEGASAYLNRQYSTIAIVGVVIGVFLWWQLGLYSGIGYLIGAILSGVAGYIGMNISVRANVRTAEAARSGVNAALQLAFRSGAVTGLLVVGLGLLGVAVYYLVLLRT
ncbi:MAG: sodium/proton-translocating pyrophosphatase, partial [Alphaproteobacteria bacterium]